VAASFEILPTSTPLKQSSFFGDEIPNGDPMLKEALAVVRSEGKASISMLQRKLRVGYNRAARLIDALEEQKIIGPQEPGVQLREVLDYGEVEETIEEETG
jgi:S-DNA-T family DNA segregation ATPase FtsK/SpoIIIE